MTPTGVVGREFDYSDTGKIIIRRTKVAERLIEKEVIDIDEARVFLGLKEQPAEESNKSAESDKKS